MDGGKYSRSRRRSTRSVRHAGNSFRRQYPRRPRASIHMDRQQWPPLAVWRNRPRRDTADRGFQRSLGVQSCNGPMDLDGRKRYHREQLRLAIRSVVPDLWPARGVRHTRFAGHRKHPWRTLRGSIMDRQQRQSLALWRDRHRCRRRRRFTRRPLELQPIHKAMDVDGRKQPYREQLRTRLH